MQNNSQCLAERDELLSVSLKVEYWYIHMNLTALKLAHFMCGMLCFWFWRPCLIALPDSMRVVLKNWTVFQVSFRTSWMDPQCTCIYIYIYTWKPNDLYFWRSTTQNKAFSKKKSHLGFRYIHTTTYYDYVYIYTYIYRYILIYIYLYTHKNISIYLYSYYIYELNIYVLYIYIS